MGFKFKQFTVQYTQYLQVIKFIHATQKIFQYLYKSCNKVLLRRIKKPKITKAVLILMMKPMQIVMDSRTLHLAEKVSNVASALNSLVIIKTENGHKRTRCFCRSRKWFNSKNPGLYTVH